MKICIIGGHLTPALALIDYIQEHQIQDQVFFIGRKYSQEQTQQLSQEQQEVSQRQVKFIAFQAIKTSHFKIWLLPMALINLIKSIKAARKILIQEQPTVVVSFGGYLALPICIAASLWLKIPIITHEQTREIGIANRIIGLLANKIALTFPDVKHQFATKKTVVIGAPLRSNLFILAPTPSWWSKQQTLPILFITGGNQGSQFINHWVEKNLAALTNKFAVIHQCGNSSRQQNYLDDLLAAKRQLPIKNQANYYVQPWFPLTELAWIFQHARLALSRAGANTVMELASFKIPSLLIPLPHSQHQEQTKNAAWLVQQGRSEVLNQTKINDQAIWQKLNQLNSLPP